MSLTHEDYKDYALSKFPEEYRGRKCKTHGNKGGECDECLEGIVREHSESCGMWNGLGWPETILQDRCSGDGATERMRERTQG